MENVDEKDELEKEDNNVSDHTANYHGENVREIEENNMLVNSVNSSHHKEIDLYTIINIIMEKHNMLVNSANSSHHKEINLNTKIKLIMEKRNMLVNSANSNNHKNINLNTIINVLVHIFLITLNFTV